jgi:receptor protein-tyrosine kinase
MVTPPSQPTLREVFRPLSRQKWLVLITVIAAVGAAIAFSFQQEPVYEATAKIAVQDQTNNLAIAGILAPTNRTPAQVALAGAQVVHAPEVVDRVRRDLALDDSTGSLIASVSTAVDSESNLISVIAEADTARGARERAAAFARTAVEFTNKQSRDEFAAQADALRERKPKRTENNADSLSQYEAQISRLTALSAISSPATVVDEPSLPGSASSPKTARNALVAGFLGLVLGLSLAFLRDSLDRRMHSLSDIEAEMDLPLVGHVRDDALGRHMPGDGKQSLDPLDWEQFRIIGRNLDFVSPGSTRSLLAVTSSVPEEGKTTVALFVALASAAAGRRTLLIECDLRRPVLAQRIPELRAAPGVTDFVAGKAAPPEILQAVKLPQSSVSGNGAEVSHQLVCITAGSPTTEPAEVLRSRRFQEMLVEVQTAYDLVVLDTTPLLPVVDALELLPKADTVLVVARAERITRDQIRTGRAAIAHLPDSSRVLVVTGLSRAEEHAYGYYGYEAE